MLCGLFGGGQRQFLLRAENAVRVREALTEGREGGRGNDCARAAFALRDGFVEVEQVIASVRGGVRVELMDKGAALGAILKAGLPQDGDPEAVASFFAALQGAAREEPASGDDGKN